MGIADELQQLEELRDRGTLTAAEFATAKAAVLAGKSAAQNVNVVSPSHCFRCSSPSSRACTLCGQLFCLAHGGERFVWVSETGDTQGIRNTLTKRIICDSCTPDPATMKRSLVVAGIFAAVVIGVMLYILKRPIGF
jgi:hypothetical protein